MGAFFYAERVVIYSTLKELKHHFEVEIDFIKFFLHHNNTVGDLYPFYILPLETCILLYLNHLPSVTYIFRCIWTILKQFK